MADWVAEQKSIYDEFANGGDAFPAVIRQKKITGDFDTATGTYPVITPAVDYDTFAIRKNYWVGNIDGTRVQDTDSMLLIPGYGLPTVTPEHDIVIGGDVQDVITITRTAPGNVTLLITAQVRE